MPLLVRFVRRQDVLGDGGERLCRLCAGRWQLSATSLRGVDVFLQGCGGLSSSASSHRDGLGSGNGKKGEHYEEKEGRLNGETEHRGKAVVRQRSQGIPRQILNRLVRLGTGHQEKDERRVKGVLELEQQVHLRVFLVLRLVFRRRAVPPESADSIEPGTGFAAAPPPPPPAGL